MLSICDPIGKRKDQLVRVYWLVFEWLYLSFRVFWE